MSATTSLLQDVQAKTAELEALLLQLGDTLTEMQEEVGSTDLHSMLIETTSSSVQLLAATATTYAAGMELNS